jgi:drug/metabolite transporter (DMT)-like permease
MSSAVPPKFRTTALTALALAAFAGNSLLCRAALRDTGIDAASFTALRILAGAAALWVIVQVRNGTADGRGSWASAAALFVYAAGFSFAYLSLTAATGALLLFGAVQVTMIGIGLMRGERLHPGQWIGVALAAAGLVGLLLPGLSAPPLGGALLMIAAGVAWGVYSLRGRAGGDATAVTAGNFVRACLPAAALSAAMLPWATIDAVGMGLALLSGAVTSGIGYAIWYAALPGLTATRAASVQLSVPVLTALAGVLLLAEPLSPRLLLASAAVLGGITLVIAVRRSVTS